MERRTKASKSSGVDSGFVGFLLHWAVNFTCLLAAPLARNFVVPQLGIPFLAVVLVFYVWWDGRTLGPSGCIATLPFLLITVVSHLWTIAVMTKALLAVRGR